MFTFHGSCNDLVLVSGHDVDGGHTLIVLNPSTWVFFEVPDSGFDIIDEMREIHIVFGFGYDSVTDDYKVVTVSFYNNDEVVNDVENIFVHVYSLKTDEWRRVCHCEEDLVRVIVAFSLSDETLSEVALLECCSDAGIEFKNGIKLVISGERLAVFVEGDVWVMK
ncbi:F-box/kelch-repeat protein At3g06240-like [Bidens hawaiensis]|uniref:F-box/kelch-repeat protein At3g06240-like n=1 Tax=Bidens hawaiensis TaxID=980011 RepID=UPI00404AEA8E